MHRPSAEALVLTPLGHHTLRFHAHRVRRRHRRDRARAVGRGGLGVQWPRAGRASVGLRFRPHGLGRRTRLVSAVARHGSFRSRRGIWCTPRNSNRETFNGRRHRSRGSGRVTDDDFSAMTAGFGVNAAHGVVRHAVFGEFTRQLASTARVRSRRAGGNGSVDRTRRLADGRRHARGVQRPSRSRRRSAANVTVYAVPEAVKPAYGPGRCRFSCSCASGRGRDTWAGCGRCAMAKPF